MARKKGKNTLSLTLNSIPKPCKNRRTMRQLLKTASIEELEYLSIPDKHREGKRRHWAFLNHTCHYISYLKKITNIT